MKKEKTGFYADATSEIFARESGKKKTKHNILTIFLLLGVCAFSIFFYTWAHLQVVHINYEIAKAKRQESEYLEINKKLKTEVATLKAPLRIKQLAKNKLGLITPSDNQVIIIK